MRRTEHLEIVEAIGRAEYAREHGRHKDVVTLMKTAVEFHNHKKSELPKSSMTLLTDAYYELADAKRKVASKVYKDELAIAKPVGNWKVPLLRNYRENIESELRTLCFETISLASDLLRNTKSLQGQLVLWKLHADFLRYLAGIEEGKRRRQLAEVSAECYSKAMDIARRYTLPCDQLRLRVALNYSFVLCKYNTGGAPSYAKAYEVTREALSSALKADHSTTFHFMDKTERAAVVKLLQLLFHNLQHWNAVGACPMSSSELAGYEDLIEKIDRGLQLAPVQNEAFKSSARSTSV